MDESPMVPDDQLNNHESLATCDSCSNASESLTSINGDSICDTCRDEDYRTCERCNDWIANSDAIRVGTRSSYDYRRINQSWCEDCADCQAFRCEDCRQTFSNSLRTGDYCNRCAAENYCTCSDCGDIVHYDNINHRGDERYCNNCDPGEDRLIHEYDYSPQFNFYGVGKFFYGVELEVTGDASEHAPTVADLMGDQAYLKADSSILDGGFEIVTHPHTLDAHRELWVAFFDRYGAYQKEGSTYTRGLKAYSNGMHVHIGRKHLTKLQIEKIDFFLNAEDNNAFVVDIAGRRSADYAKIFHKPLGHGDCDDRYVAFNRTNRNTVEIRIFRGTVDRDRFFANLEFCDALRAFTAQAGNQSLTHQEFVRFVRKNRKAYPKLDALLIKLKYVSVLASANNLVKHKEKACAS